MLDDLKNELSSFKLLGMLLTIAVIIYLLQITWDVFNNFSDIISLAIISWVLSFLMEPVVKKLSKITKLSLPWATLIIYLLFATLIGLIIYLVLPPLYIQFVQLATAIPAFLVKSPPVIQRLGTNAIESLSNYLYLIPIGAQFFVSFFIVLILSFYFIVEKETINNEFFDLIPDRWHENVKFTQKVIDQTFASFFRVQLIFGIIVGILTWLVLELFGINFAAPIAVMTGIFTVIPFIGQIISVVIPVLFAFLADPTKAIFIFIILVVAQQFIFNVYGPRLMGKAFRLHPLIVFISFFIGVKIYGIIGGIFAVPVLGIIVVVFHELSRHYKHPTIKE